MSSLDPGLGLVKELSRLSKGTVLQFADLHTTVYALQYTRVSGSVAKIWGLTCIDIGISLMCYVQVRLRVGNRTRGMLRHD
jgi:hypothetical protein